MSGAAAREALQLVIPQVERALRAPVVNVVEVIQGTAPGWRLRLDVAGTAPVFLKASDGSAWADEALEGEVALITTVRHRHMPPVLASGATDTVPWMAPLAGRVTLAGDRLVHGDLGAGNVCIAQGQVIVVDWSDAYVGNADIDLVTVAVDAAHAGGGRVLPPVSDPAAWLAKVAGLVLVASARPPWPRADGQSVRQQQADLARTAVAWALDVDPS